MSTYETPNLRSIALIGHGACGKTTLVEAMLFRTGMIENRGRIQQGTTTSDNDPQEKEARHSMRLSVTHLDAKFDQLPRTRIHVLDTPGYPDYISQDYSALDAVRSVALVIDATKKVDQFARRMMNLAKERKLCRMIIINKMDEPDADIPQRIEELREAFGDGVLPINLPKEGFTHVIDCFEKEEGVADYSSVAEVHQAFIERIVEEDDRVLEQYLEQGKVNPASLHNLITKALREDHIIPICFTSAKKLIGIRDLLKVIIRHMPSAFEANRVSFLRADGSIFRPQADPALPFIAQVFKNIIDPYLGKISVFRVHQGKVTKNSTLYCDDNKKAFKVGHLYVLQGKQTIETERLSIGDIGAVTKVPEIQYSSILHRAEADQDLRLQPLPFPKPMFSLAIQPRRHGDEKRLSDALIKLQQEDPTLRIDHNNTTNETIIRGLTSTHINSVLDRMKTMFDCAVKVSTPSIPYRETITCAAEGHARHKKQTGGAGQFGEVYLRIRPLERNQGFEFVDIVKGGAIPFNLIPAVEKGVREVLQQGFIAGYPLQDLRVTVYDGKTHPVDSKEVAFIAAGKKAFLDALEKAQVKVLEPIVRLEISVPDQYLGDVTGDLASRRGQVLDTAMDNSGIATIYATAPLGELDSYSTQLRALTKGRGRWSMDLDTYSPTSVAKQEELARQFHRIRED